MPVQMKAPGSASDIQQPRAYGHHEQGEVFPDGTLQPCNQIQRKLFQAGTKPTELLCRSLPLRC